MTNPLWIEYGAVLYTCGEIPEGPVVCAASLVSEFQATVQLFGKDYMPVLYAGHQAGIPGYG